MTFFYDDSLPKRDGILQTRYGMLIAWLQAGTVDDSLEQPDYSGAAVKWMNEVTRKAVGKIDSDFRKFRISEALMVSYKLFWDEFSSWFP
jgi:valyl-tRNA synthetase